MVLYIRIYAYSIGSMDDKIIDSTGSIAIMELHNPYYLQGDGIWEVCARLPYF